MEGIINFQFGGETHTASYVICQKQEPTYVYVFFESQKLKQEFGEEVCIHTQNSQLIEGNIYSERRRELFLELLAQIKKLHSLAAPTGKSQLHEHKNKQ